MAIKKYINTGELAGLTGCLDEEIRELAKKGVLPAHKTRRGYWRFNVDAAEKFFGIVINPIMDLDDEEEEEQMSTEKEQTASNTRLIIENHYKEIIERVRAAKSSIKIMTGDFKRFKLKPTAKQGKNYNDGTPFIRFLMEKAEQGVSVEIVCSSPSRPFMEEYEMLYKQKSPKRFKIYFCIRNHAKVMIVDDKVAYVGSANVTKAGLGQGVLSPGNFEVGIMTENPEVISSLNDHFSTIMNGGYCADCHRANQCVEY